MTCNDHGSQRPGPAGLYWPKAAVPLACTAMSFEPEQAWPGPTIQPTTFSGPVSQRSWGGMEMTTSSRRSWASAVMS